MLKERDWNILRHIEMYGAISLKNVSSLYFDGEYKTEEYRYRCAARRMQALEKKGILLSYRNSYTEEKIFYLNKKVSPHDLFIQDLWRKLKELNFKILEFNINVSLMNGQLKPDALIVADYEGTIVNYFLEVDLNHYTSKSKLIKYEMFYKSDEFKKICNSESPCLIIARPTHTRDIRLTSKLFDIIYTDLKYSKLERFIFED
ncbi:hypothetical protein [Clostridium perfringens]|uniref:hypothetical protein n=1 Tax=Clostridium perfringens TaxID=1502 RepID=UPI001C85A746|nr:hypothetical protein [Clostridium perfringens]